VQEFLMPVPRHHSEPDSPAQRITNLLARRGPSTVAQLVAALGVTTTAVRQQVNRLVAEGWLIRTRRRHGPGRPADVLELSSDARRTFGGQGGELSRLLLEEIAEIEGPERRRALLEAVGRRMAQDARRFVGDGSPAERLQRLAELLSREGVLAEAETGGRAARLAVYTCPYYGVATEHREVCDMERAAFSAVIGDAVSLERCVLDGHERCEFRRGGVGAEPGRVAPKWRKGSARAGKGNDKAAPGAAG
jgi:DeoR family transcriptional regulator, suf operon transcriptional repressor